MNNQPNIREPEEGNVPERSAADSRAASLRLRRRICILLACLAVFVAVAIPLINCLSESDTPELPELPTEAPELFEEPDYEYDILNDKEYLALNRDIYYSDGTVTTAIERSDCSSLGTGVSLLWDMIDCIIAGDAEGYNALFTQKYITQNGKKEAFTMQQVYGANAHTGILFELDSSETVEEDGQTVHYQLYRVTYRIHKNNGTFRRDIGQDEARTQLILLTDREGGEAKIDSISYQGYQ